MNMNNKAQFCKCNNCEEVFFDTNPSEQPFFKIPENKGFNELTTQEGEDGFFQGCPTCKTDGYLKDVTEESELFEERNPMCKKYPDSEVLPDEDENCSLCGGDCNNEAADLINWVREYIELSEKGDIRERFNKLENQIEEELNRMGEDVPEMDVCAFLKERFKKEL